MPTTQATISTAMGSTRSTTLPLPLPASLSTSPSRRLPEKMSPLSRALRSWTAIGPYSRPVIARKIIITMVKSA